jgi:hypothetical protein
MIRWTGHAVELLQQYGGLRPCGPTFPAGGRLLDGDPSMWMYAVFGLAQLWLIVTIALRRHLPRGVLRASAVVFGIQIALVYIIEGWIRYWCR